MKYLLLLLFISIPAFGDVVECEADDPNCGKVSACKMSLEEMQARMEPDIAACKKARDNADDCCSNGTNCGGGGGLLGGGGGNSDMSQLLMVMKGAAGMAAVMNASSGQLQDMSQLCMMNGLLGGTGGTMNGSGASQCDRAKDSCNETCTDLGNFYEAFKSCGKDASEDVRNYVSSKVKTFSDVPKRCDRITSTQRAQAQNMNNVGNSNSLNGVCNQVAQQQQLNAIAAPASAVDCTNPMIANTTACTQCNGQASVSAACATAVKDAAATVAGFQPASAQTGSPSNIATSDLNGMTQGPHFPDANSPAAPDAPFNPYGQGGSGGFPPNQNQQQGGVGPNGQRAGYGSGVDGKAYTLGERAGTGGTSGANGFVDYGTTGNGIDPNRSTASIDLRRYLPGQKLYQRKVAGVGSANPEINARSTDIFQRISDRFQVICSLNRLVDCTPNHIPNKSGL